MQKLILSLMVVFATSTSVAGGARPGGRGSERTEDPAKLRENSTIRKAIEDVNRLHEELSLPRFEIEDVAMSPKAQGDFAASLQGYIKALQDAAKSNSNRIVEVRSQGIIDVTNLLLQMKPDFAAAAKTNQDAKAVENLPDAAIRWLKSALEETTSIDQIKAALDASLTLGRSGINEASIKGLIESLEKVGLKLEDVIKCK